jgi:hypothetical protein
MLQNAPGGSTRWMAEERRSGRRKIGMLAMAALSEVFLLFISLPTAVGVPIALAGFWAIDRSFLRWMDLLSRREQDAIRGAEAEEKVGAQLDRLANCVVLHDVPADYGNVDHLVFRKDGAVFLFETKSRCGTITDAVAAPYLKQTHWNVYWLRDVLKSKLGIKPWIHAAIVFPNATVKVRSTMRGVEILSGSELERWISQAHGDPVIAHHLWPEIERIKSELIGQSSV